ncbi:MAG TPA: hypothetical protein PLV45_03465 [bacterium]|nr:hypothetical protein [bacterium]
MKRRTFLKGMGCTAAALWISDISGVSKGFQGIHGNVLESEFRPGFRLYGRAGGCSTPSMWDDADGSPEQGISEMCRRMI